MTNAEKFKEVFGFDSSYEYACVAVNSTYCKDAKSCDECDWWSQEYKKPCCGNCRHHTYDDTYEGYMCWCEESDAVGEWTSYDECCECWEGR